MVRPKKKSCIIYIFYYYNYEHIHYHFHHHTHALHNIKCKLNKSFQAVYMIRRGQEMCCDLFFFFAFIMTGQCRDYRKRRVREREGCWVRKGPRA